MTKSVLTAILAAVSGVCASAHAVQVTGQISFSGYVVPVGSTGQGAATGLDFVSGPSGTPSASAGSVIVYGAGTGSFAALGSAANLSGVGSIKDLPDFTTAAPISNFVALTSSPSVSLDLTTIASVSHNVPADSLTLTAFGTLHYAGFDDTPVKFSLTSVGDDTVSYSSTITTIVPEPASIIGLGGLCLWAAGRRIHSRHAVRSEAK